MRLRGSVTWLLTAEALSVTGSRMSMIALPWLVLGITGRPALVGLVAALETVPYVVAGAIGAPLIDRLGARRVSVSADCASVVLMAAVPLALSHGMVPLSAVVILAGAARGISDLAKKILLPATARRSGVELARATAMFDGISRLGALIGGPVAGVLIAWIGARAVLLVDSASFLLCALLVVVALPKDDPAAQPKGEGSGPEESESYLRSLRQGFSYVKNDRLLVSIVGVMFVVNLCDTAGLSVYIPVWSEDIARSPVALGLCTGAFSLGAVFGNIGLVILLNRLPRLTVLALGLLIGGAPRFVALGLSESVAAVCVVMFTAGVGLSSVNPVIGTALYHRLPATYQARVFGIITASAFAGIPLGSALGGVLLEAVGLRTAALATAGLYLAVALAMIADRRTWRQVSEVQPGAEEAGTASTR